MIAANAGRSGRYRSRAPEQIRNFRGCFLRKDVEKLSQIYHDHDGRTDLEVLGWPNAQDIPRRYEALLSPLDFSAYSRQRPLRLLDFGSGLGFLLDWLAANDLLDRVDYTGVDLSAPILAEVRKRWPDQRFDFRDIRDEPFPAEAFDFAIICGIFTVKHENSYEETRALAQGALEAIWPSVKIGLAFNSMSKHVDWERDDLFHWPLDDIMVKWTRFLGPTAKLEIARSV